MLDNLLEIQKLDKSNALGIIAGQPNQLRHEFNVQLSSKTYKNIVVAGMGGSALAAEFIRSWLISRLPMPFEISRDYSLPGFVSGDTLVIASSYSGNTEETLSALTEAENKGADIVVISAGGKLAEVARDKGYPYFEVPAGLQPRLAVLYGARALADILVSLGILEGIVAELTDAAEWMEQHYSTWTAEVQEENNLAKQIALLLQNHGVVIYGGPTLLLPAMKWKIDINENAKNVAFWNHFPEFNHNEFNGWISFAPKDLKVVELLSSLDHPQVQKRFEVTNRLLSGKMPTPIQVQVEGETKLQQMMWALILGDFVSAYLAFLNDIDPTPVDLIEKLKKELT